jgi:hypothetical protein
MSLCSNQSKRAEVKTMAFILNSVRWVTLNKAAMILSEIAVTEIDGSLRTVVPRTAIIFTRKRYLFKRAS